MSGREGLVRRLEALNRARPLQLVGRVTEVTGLVVRAALARARLGDWVELRTAGRPDVSAEVVAIRGEQATLMPLGELRGIGPDSQVISHGRPFEIQAGWQLLGRVLDGLGRPLDGKPLPAGLEPWPVDRPAPHPLQRRPITRPLHLGIRAVDGLLTVGEGQRVGIFAGSGVGKSTLLGQMVRAGGAEAAVVCLVGERGREVRELVEETLGAEGLARSVVIVATSDAPARIRVAAAQVATALAEWFAETGGRQVLLLLDSLTRLARAQREIGIASGEPPGRQGYPPSVFSLLAGLLERTGNRAQGGITALYTVLVAGGDLDEPIADEARGILDGHLVLDRRLANRSHWPAIDVLASVSRLMPVIAGPEQRSAAARVRTLLADYERQRDLIALGAYQAGSDRRTDEAIQRIDAIERFLRQGSQERVDLAETLAQLQELAA
jgi:type III secretion protein N (ATPase)